MVCVGSDNKLALGLGCLIGLYILNSQVDSRLWAIKSRAVGASWELSSRGAVALPVILYICGVFLWFCCFSSVVVCLVVKCLFLFLLFNVLG